MSSAWNEIATAAGILYRREYGPFTATIETPAMEPTRYYATLSGAGEFGIHATSAFRDLNSSKAFAKRAVVALEKLNKKEQNDGLDG